MKKKLLKKAAFLEQTIEAYCTCSCSCASCVCSSCNCLTCWCDCYGVSQLEVSNRISPQNTKSESYSGNPTSSVNSKSISDNNNGNLYRITSTGT